MEERTCLIWRDALRSCPLSPAHTATTECGPPSMVQYAATTERGPPYRAQCRATTERGPPDCLARCAENTPKFRLKALILSSGSAPKLCTAARVRQPGPFTVGSRGYRPGRLLRLSGRLRRSLLRLLLWLALLVFVFDLAADFLVYLLAAPQRQAYQGHNRQVAGHGQQRYIPPGHALNLCVIALREGRATTSPMGKLPSGPSKQISGFLAALWILPPRVPSPK